MPLISGESSTEIAAPIARCWEVVAAIDHAPEWQNGLERVDVVERDDQGRPVVCDIVSDAKVAKVHVRVRVDYDPPHRLSFTRVASDDVDELNGGWELEEVDAERTRATYRLAIDPGPVPLMARPLVKALRPLVVGARADELARAVTGEPRPAGR